MFSDHMVFLVHFCVQYILFKVNPSVIPFWMPVFPVLLFNWDITHGIIPEAVYLWKLLLHNGLMKVDFVKKASYMIMLEILFRCSCLLIRYETVPVHKVLL